MAITNENMQLRENSFLYECPNNATTATIKADITATSQIAMDNLNLMKSESDNKTGICKYPLRVYTSDRLKEASYQIKFAVSGGGVLGALTLTKIGDISDS